MDSAKIGRWIFPFMKFGMVRVKKKTRSMKKKEQFGDKVYNYLHRYSFWYSSKS